MAGKIVQMHVPDGFVLVQKSSAVGSGCLQAAAPAPSKSSTQEKDAKDSQPQTAAAPSLRTIRAALAAPRRVKHPTRGSLDVYSVVLTTPSGATSDASGNLPGYFNVGGQLVNSGAWATMVSAFDIVRVKKVVFKFVPKLGYKTARSYTPLTATALQVLRVAVDPEGALSSPTVANMLARSPTKQPYPCSDHFMFEPFEVTYVPQKPIVRFSATALTATTLHDWMDVGDVNSYAVNGTLVGGIVWNVIQAGACPASTDIFGVSLLFHCEFALRNG